jgi:hypothetical protein
MSVVDQARIGMTKKKFIGCSRSPRTLATHQYRTPGIYRYGSIEFRFELWAKG